MNPTWVESLRQQCVGAEVPFFFKQWGNYAPIEMVTLPPGSKRKRTQFEPERGGHTVVNVGKGAAGRLLNGAIWDQVPDTGSGL